MVEHDPWSGLRELAREGEESARPLPAARVRRLGDQRRTRRHVGLVAAAAALVVAASGVAISQVMPDTSPQPNPAGTPSVVTASPSPAPARTVTAVNLVEAGDVPVVGQERWAATPAGTGRPGEAVTVCVPDGGYDELGAVDTVNRNFRLDRRAGGETNPPAAPLGAAPSVYTQALQFDSSAAAEKAYQTYRGWVDRCAATLRTRGDTPIGGAGEWLDVKTSVSGASAAFTELTWRPQQDTTESGYFESVGLALVGDRLAVTVSLVYGMDYNGVAYDQKGDPDLGLPPHPQYFLVSAASAALEK